MRVLTGVVVLAATVLVGCGGGGTGDAADTTPAGATNVEQRNATPTSSPEQTEHTEQTGQPAPAATTAGAVARFEQFLHALGDQDIDTVCEIAGPAAKKAEDEGFGPCEQTFGYVFQMISPAQKTALKTATVDTGQITATTPTKIEIPAAAVQAAVTFTSGDLGDYTVEYLGEQWFITD